jgi:IclR family pca regulon transcriptional regulator
MSVAVDVGSRVPAYATSMGRVLTAWADSAVVDAVIAAGLHRLAQRTITDPTAYRDALHRVRKQGYAVVESELEDGLLSAAVPVRDPHGEVLAALAYSTTSGRMTAAKVVDTVVPLMLETAAAISADLELVRTRPRAIPARDGFF